MREYAIDEDSETLTEIWSAGHGRGRRALYGGEAWRLPGGNTLHGLGSASHIVEYDPSGEVVWEARWQGGQRLGQSVTFGSLYELLP